MRLIDADRLLEVYDQIHIGPPGNARIMIATAPTVEMPGWISVQDRLPEETGDYLVFARGGVIWPYSFTEGTWFDFDGYKTDSVTHWMPLPEPPKEVSVDAAD